MRASKAYDPSFIKVITVCLPYGPIVIFFLVGGRGFFSLRVPTSVTTVREKTVVAKGSFGCFVF